MGYLIELFFLIVVYILFYLNYFFLLYFFIHFEIFIINLIKYYVLIILLYLHTLCLKF
jgi:hypothetical protein